MNFLDRIKIDMYKAMKENDKNKVGVLRSLLSKLKNKRIDNGKILEFSLISQIKRGIFPFF